jgi:large subunit ribosomal protein L4e
MNLLQLAPGGHMGRLIVWTQSAYEKLDTLFGTRASPSAVKSKFVLPRPIMANSDLTRLINSDEIQSRVLPPKDNGVRKSLKKNPLKNFGAMVKLNPYAKAAKRMALLAEANRKKLKAEKLADSRKGLKAKKAGKDVGKRFYKQMIVDSDYKGDHYDNFSTWLQA